MWGLSSHLNQTQKKSGAKCDYCTGPFCLAGFSYLGKFCARDFLSIYPEPPTATQGSLYPTTQFTLCRCRPAVGDPVCHSLLGVHPALQSLSVSEPFVLATPSRHLGPEQKALQGWLLYHLLLPCPSDGDAMFSLIGKVWIMSVPRFLNIGGLQKQREVSKWTVESIGTIFTS